MASSVDQLNAKSISYKWSKQADADVFKNAPSNAQLLAEVKAEEATQAKESGIKPADGSHFEKQYFDDVFSGTPATMVAQADAEQKSIDAENKKNQKNKQQTVGSMTAGNVKP